MKTEATTQQKVKKINWSKKCKKIKKKLQQKDLFLNEGISLSLFHLLQTFMFQYFYRKIFLSFDFCLFCCCYLIFFRWVHSKVFVVFRLIFSGYTYTNADLYTYASTMCSVCWLSIYVYIHPHFDILKSVKTKNVKWTYEKFFHMHRGFRRFLSLQEWFFINFWYYTHF